MLQMRLLFAEGHGSSCGTKIPASGCQVSPNPRSDPPGLPSDECVLLAFAPINADFLADRQVRNLGRLRRVDRQIEQATMDENRVEGTARNLGR